MIMRELPYRAVGNHRFDGYAVELVDFLSQTLEFNYTLILQEDGSYGSMNKLTGEFNGMMREIMDDVGIDSLKLLHVLAFQILASRSCRD